MKTDSISRLPIRLDKGLISHTSSYICVWISNVLQTTIPQQCVYGCSCRASCQTVLHAVCINHGALTFKFTNSYFLHFLFSQRSRNNSIPPCALNLLITQHPFLVWWSGLYSYRTSESQTPEQCMMMTFWNSGKGSSGGWEGEGGEQQSKFVLLFIRNISKF